MAEDVAEIWKPLARTRSPVFAPDVADHVQVPGQDGGFRSLVLQELQKLDKQQALAKEALAQLQGTQEQARLHLRTALAHCEVDGRTSSTLRQHPAALSTAPPDDVEPSSAFMESRLVAALPLPRQSGSLKPALCHNGLASSALEDSDAFAGSKINATSSQRLLTAVELFVGGVETTGEEDIIDTDLLQDEGQPARRSRAALAASRSKLEDDLSQMAAHPSLAFSDFRGEVKETRSQTLNFCTDRGKVGGGFSTRLQSTSEAQVKSSLRSASVNAFGSVGADVILAPTLPSNWPSTLKIRANIQDPVEEAVIRTRTTAKIFDYTQEQIAIGMQASHHRSIVDFDAIRKQQWERWIIDPFSPRRAIFDMIGALVLITELTGIPVLLAWDVRMTAELRAMAVMTGSWWGLDLCANFVTGYHDNGELVVDPKLVVRHYVQSWFPLDCFVVLIDIFSLSLVFLSAQDTSAANVRLLRIVKVGQLLRLADLARVFRVARLFKGARHLSDVTRLSMRFSMVLLGMLWINHLLSCIWFYIGRSVPTDTGLSWMDIPIFQFEPERDTYDSTGTLYQYATAYHWSIAQMTLGAMDVYAVNSAERAFTIFALIFGFAGGSTLISVISSTMIEVHMMRQEQLTKLYRLSEYLKQNQIRGRLAMRVQHSVQRRILKNHIITEENVGEALTLLPSALRSELRFQVFRPHMERHPLIRSWFGLDLLSVKNLALSALNFVFLHSGDYLFEPAATAQGNVWLLLSGQMDYTQTEETSPVPHKVTEVVEADQWICEAVWWVDDWIHVGLAEATESTKLMVLDAETALQVLKRHSVIYSLVQDYALRFHDCIVRAKPPLVPYPSDLLIPFTEFDDIVAAMAPQSQAVVGLAALDIVEKQRIKGWSHNSMRKAKQLTDLKQEVSDGMSLILLNSDGEAERVVSVVAVHVERADSAILVQLAKMTDSDADGSSTSFSTKWQPSCKLPGLKLQRGERATDALRRLEQRLPPFFANARYTGIERKVATNQSSKYGVRTKYLRFECSARIGPDKKQRPSDAEDDSSERPSYRVSRTSQLGTGSFAAHVARRSQFQMPMGGFGIGSWGVSAWKPVRASVTSSQASLGISERDVILHARTMYTWMQKEEFDIISSEAGQIALAAWLHDHADRVGAGAEDDLPRYESSVDDIFGDPTVEFQVAPPQAGSKDTSALPSEAGSGFEDPLEGADVNKMVLNL